MWPSLDRSHSAERTDDVVDMPVASAACSEFAEAVDIGDPVSAVCGFKPAVEPFHQRRRSSRKVSSICKYAAGSASGSTADFVSLDNSGSRSPRRKKRKVISDPFVPCYSEASGLCDTSFEHSRGFKSQRPSNCEEGVSSRSNEETRTSESTGESDKGNIAKVKEVESFSSTGKPAESGIVVPGASQPFSMKPVKVEGDAQAEEFYNVGCVQVKEEESVFCIRKPREVEFEGSLASRLVSTKSMKAECDAGAEESHNMRFVNVKEEESVFTVKERVQIDSVEVPQPETEESDKDEAFQIKKEMPFLTAADLMEPQAGLSSVIQQSSTDSMKTQNCSLKERGQAKAVVIKEEKIVLDVGKPTATESEIASSSKVNLSAVMMASLDEEIFASDSGVLISNEEITVDELMEFGESGPSSYKTMMSSMARSDDGGLLSVLRKIAVHGLTRHKDEFAEDVHHRNKESSGSSGQDERYEGRIHKAEQIRRLVELSDLPEDEMEAIALLQQYGVLPLKRECKHGHLSRVYIDYRGVARWTDTICDVTAGLRVGTWFGSGSRLSFVNAVKFIFAWCRELTTLEWCQQELGMTPITVREWTGCMREVCVHDLGSKFGKKIGGHGKIVEIDESLFKKPKEDWGSKRRKCSYWVFGGICRETKEGFVVQIADRKAATLMRTIKENILEGTTVCCNFWGRYSTKDLDAAGYSRLAARRAYKFIDSKTLIGTGDAERIWDLEKWHRKHSLGISLNQYYQSFLIEFIWRHVDHKDDPFGDILRAIKNFWPLE